MPMNVDKTAIIFVSSDPIFDQRAQKVKDSLSQMGYSVQICGVERHEEAFETEDLRWKMAIKSGPLFYLFLGLKILLHLRKNPPTLVWACDPDTLWAAGLMKRWKSFFLVYDSHEWFTEVPELEGKGLKKWIWNLLENRGARNSDVCLTVSNPIAEQLSQKTGREFQVLMNMPNLTSFEIQTEKECIIIYQGAINKGRRVRELIAAIEYAPEWEVWIAGKGDEEESIKSWSKTLHFQHRIKWLGMLSKSELAKATKQAKVGYNGLDWQQSKSYEFSLANKFFDYVSLGIPVITAPTPTYRDMMQSYNVGWLEGESIVSILDQIEKEPMEYKNRVDACYFARNIWTWEEQWKSIQTWIP